MSQIGIRHVTHRNEPFNTQEVGEGRIVYEQVLKDEWVQDMLHIGRGHVTQLKDACHTHEKGHMVIACGQSGVGNKSHR